MYLRIPIIALCFVQTVSPFCYWNSPISHKYFANLTPYSSVRGDIRDSVVKITGCEPISIWGLIRHGKRTPNARFTEYMKDAIAIQDYVSSSYEQGNSSLCAQDVENLFHWVDEENILETPNEITNEGYKEMVGIGRRLKQAFPKLLAQLHTNDYVFGHAKEKWIKDSATGFVEVFNNEQLRTKPNATNIDLLNIYYNCPKYMAEVKNNPRTFDESTKYLETSDYLAAKDRIQGRLGTDYILTETNITALYDLCRYFSSGIDSQSSPWCALFTPEDLKPLEYIVDLDQYYRTSYGSPMSEAFGQIVLADLLKKFQAAKRGHGKKITNYISHSTLLNMAFIALKLYKDDMPLTSAFRNPKRKWKSSSITSFAANFIAVLNKCKVEGNSESFNVVFYLNEEPLTKLCNQGVCSWEEFEDLLVPFLNTNTDFCESKAL